MRAMTTSNDQTLALLHALLRICRDSVEGYARAERDLPDRSLAAEFEGYRRQRQKIVAELENRIRDLRGDPDASPTAAGALHRAWMDLRAIAGAHPNETVLVEMERGEDFAADAFRQALREPEIDAATRHVLEHHYELVQTAHDRVKQWRDRSNLARPV